MIRGVLLALLAVAVPVAAADRERPEIRDLICAADDDRILVSYTVANAWGERQLERLRSGVPVEFRHRVELRSRRALLLPDRVPSRTVIHTRVTFDALIRRYEATRRVEVQRGDDEPGAAVEERRSFDDLPDVRAFTATLRDVELHVPAGALDDDAVVRVESDLGRRWAWFIVPTSIDAVGRCELSRP